MNRISDITYSGLGNHSDNFAKGSFNEDFFCNLGTIPRETLGTLSFLVKKSKIQFYFYEFFSRKFFFINIQFLFVCFFRSIFEFFSKRLNVHERYTGFADING